jgi:hypothetical protein
MPENKMATKTKSRKKKWSANVTEHSNAMDLQKDIFKSKDPDKIAASLKHSAEESHRRKASPFQSAMSMLNFYENRAGRNLTKTQRAPLEKAKNSLRKLFGKDTK